MASRRAQNALGAGARGSITLERQAELKSTLTAYVNISAQQLLAAEALAPTAAADEEQGSAMGVQIPDDKIDLIVARLGACRLLFATSPKDGCLQTLQLNVPPEEVAIGLQNDPICSKALNLLRSS
jgi:hypothetical protein